MQDPCSILNNPAFIAQQNQQIAQDIATAGPIEQATLAALTGVPVNIGNDAVYCQSNPGVAFIDSMGIKIQCPSPSHTDVTTGGQPMSTYSTVQLAQMLAQQYGSQSPATGGNAPAVIHWDGIFQTGGGSLSTGGGTSGGGGGGTTPGGTGGGGGSAPGGAGGGTNAGSSNPPASLAANPLAALTNSFTIAGMAIPIWALLGGGLAALWFFGGRR